MTTTAATGTWDEAAVDEPLARAALEVVEAHDLRALRALVHERTRAAGLGFGEREFVVDPVPRVLPAEEWAALAAGLEQRLRALDAFVADVYGPQRIVRDGVLPGRVLGGAEHYEPELAGLRPPGRRWIGLAGFDVVRGADGTLMVLEDNLRTPSGLAYALAARRAVLAVLPELADAVEPVDGAVELLGAALRAAVPPAAPDPTDPHVVLLSDGPGNSARWEHEHLAAALDIPLVEPADLLPRGDRILLRGSLRPVDVIYRRTDADRAGSDLGRLLVPAVRRGALGVVNPFGTGVADDKLAQAYVEDMVRYYLGEEPLIGSVPTYDLARPLALREALERFGELVVKPRSGSGGRGVVINPRAKPEEVEQARRAVIADPGAWVAQPLVCLSTHPTVIGDGLAPRHVDLRPFVAQTIHGPVALPAALTRVALPAGELVVNSSRDGGGKDTWVPRA